MTNELTIPPTDQLIVDSASYQQVYTTALKLFTEQALLTKNPDEVSLKDLQTSKAKSENFLAAIAGMLEISHKVDLLAAERDKFKRVDELRLLNNLRTQFEKAANFSNRTLDLCLKRLDKLYERMESEELTAELVMDIGNLQSFVEQSINTLKTISEGTTKLIKAERETGGRSSGNTGGLNITMANTTIEEPPQGTNGNKSKPRKLSPEEAAKFAKQNSSE